MYIALKTSCDFSREFQLDLRWRTSADALQPSSSKKSRSLLKSNVSKERNIKEKGKNIIASHKKIGVRNN